MELLQQLQQQPEDDEVMSLCEPHLLVLVDDDDKANLLSCTQGRQSASDVVVLAS